MLRTVLTESARATTIPRRSPLRHLRAVHRHVGPSAHRDTDVRLGESRRIIDAVAGHGDDATFFLKAFDQQEFVCRLDLAMHVVDVEPRTYRLGGGLAIASRHDDAQARCL